MIYADEENFMLGTPLAKSLYYEIASKLPVIDFHNHLNVCDVVTNRRYNDLAELWLLSDPYKHRAMRICGVEERLITGNAGNFEKFYAWCSIFPELAGNPLFHWSDMELSKIFGIDKKICVENAKYIWEAANEKLSLKEFYAKSLLDKFNVEYAAPCMSIFDDVSVLKGEKNLAPSMRCDDILPFNSTVINKLDKKPESLEALAKVFSGKMTVLHEAGCRFSDHALDDGFIYFKDDGKNEERFKRLLGGEVLSDEEEKYLCSAVLRILGKEYAKRGWAMQLHCGARRYTSTRLRNVAGPAGGFAAIGNSSVEAITEFLNDLEKEELLPRTIVFTLNPSDNAAISILSGSFCEDGIRGKVQQGTAWWWCDHAKGMREVFESMSAYSVISTFLGMTTDSRNILSFVRHEYFRRIFCGWLGEKAEKGEMPKDTKLLSEIVRNVCYENVKNILKF